MRDRLWRGLALSALLALLGGAARPAGAQESRQGAERPYVLSPDDQLDIAVLGHDDLKESVTVLPDGTFRYPVVGPVHAAGMTVDGLTRALRLGLSGQLNQPQVTVSVRQSRPRNVSVLGAVRAPGLYPVRPGTHLLDVLAACGGPAQAPELTAATLVLDGGRRSLPLDVPRLLGGADTSQNLPLEAGDVLLVQARDASAAEVQVTGEVVRPGAYPVPAAGGPLLSLLNAAGGATPRAALTRAQVLHGGRVRTVNLRPLQSSLGDPAGAVRLAPGDVLLVPAGTDRVAVLGEVKAPAAYDVPDGGALTATAALVLAGGPTPDADRRKATILRPGADGRPVVQPVDLGALLRGDPAAPNVALQPGDILYVPTRKPGGGGFNPLTLLGLLPVVGALRR